MPKSSNIVHQYFRKELGDATLLVKVNIIQLKATEITLSRGREPKIRDLDIDEEILEDLKADGFTEASALEFNLYLSGLA